MHIQIEVSNLGEDVFVVRTHLETNPGHSLDLSG